MNNCVGLDCPIRSCSYAHFRIANTNGRTLQSKCPQIYNKFDIWYPLLLADRSQSMFMKSCSNLIIGTRAWKIFSTFWHPGTNVFNEKLMYCNTVLKSVPAFNVLPLAWNTNLHRKEERTISKCKNTLQNNVW